MSKFILFSEKNWHDDIFDRLKSRKGEKWIRASNKSDFNIEYISRAKPDKIFIPHWSYIIPPEIFTEYECIVFHMTDLPFGRGGSPLQNLIVRGHNETVISAIKVQEGLDTGDVYLKQPLNLNGTAEEIFMRSSGIIEKMINIIIDHDLWPVPQQGEVVEFKRRKPEDGNISMLDSIHTVYDYIRMLDAEGYPSAFAETGKFKLEFSRASLKFDNTIIADVRISEK